MANQQAKDSKLVASKAPNLPIAPVQYTQQYQDQVLNSLRLYFNQVDNFSGGVANDTGGKYLRFPYIAAGDTTTQYATGNNTPTIVLWNTLFEGNAFDLNSDNSKNVLTVPQVITFKPDNLHATAAKKLFENTNLTSEKAFALYKQILIDQHKERFLLNKGK